MGADGPHRGQAARRPRAPDPLPGWTQRHRLDISERHHTTTRGSDVSRLRRIPRSFPRRTRMVFAQPTAFAGMRAGGKPNVVRVAQALHRIGLTSPKALRLIAEIWRDIPQPDTFTWEQSRETDIRTIDLLEKGKLLLPAPDSAYNTVANEWRALSTPSISHPTRSTRQTLEKPNNAGRQPARISCAKPSATANRAMPVPASPRPSR